MVHFFLWKVGSWFPKWKEGDASFARQQFFLLDCQVIRIFCFKNLFIILKIVTYVICGRMCFQAARDRLGNYWLAIFLETAAI